MWPELWFPSFRMLRMRNEAALRAERRDFHVKNWGVENRPSGGRKIRGEDYFQLLKVLLFTNPSFLEKSSIIMGVHFDSITSHPHARFSHLSRLASLFMILPFLVLVRWR